MSPKKAAALRYEKNYKSPVVCAMGTGEIAERIIEKASESDIPIVENSELVDNLSKLSIGQNIPQELYAAVAEIIAFIYNLNDVKKTQTLL